MTHAILIGVPCGSCMQSGNPQAHTVAFRTCMLDYEGDVPAAQDRAKVRWQSGPGRSLLPLCTVVMEVRNAQGAAMYTMAMAAHVRDQRGMQLKHLCQHAQPMQQLPMAPKNTLPLKSSASSSCRASPSAVAIGQPYICLGQVSARSFSVITFLF